MFSFDTVNLITNASAGSQLSAPSNGHGLTEEFAARLSTILSGVHGNVPHGGLIQTASLASNLKTHPTAAANSDAESIGDGETQQSLPDPIIDLPLIISLSIGEQADQISNVHLEPVQALRPDAPAGSAILSVTQLPNFPGAAPGTPQLTADGLQVALRKLEEVALRIQSLDGRASGTTGSTENNSGLHQTVPSTAQDDKMTSAIAAKSPGVEMSVPSGNATALAYGADIQIRMTPAQAAANPVTPRQGDQVIGTLPAADQASGGNAPGGKPSQNSLETNSRENSGGATRNSAREQFPDTGRPAPLRPHSQMGQHSEELPPGSAVAAVAKDQAALGTGLAVGLSTQQSVAPAAEAALSTLRPANAVGHDGQKPVPVPTEHLAASTPAASPEGESKPDNGNREKRRTATGPSQSAQPASDNSRAQNGHPATGFAGALDAHPARDIGQYASPLQPVSANSPSSVPEVLVGLNHASGQAVFGGGLENLASQGGLSQGLANGHAVTTNAQGGTPTSPFHPAHQVAMHISRAVSAGETKFNIRLDPPELGRIQVRMEFGSDGAMRATVIADTRETVDLLQRDARHLERALHDAGIKTESGGLNFSLSQGQSGNGQSAFASSLDRQGGENGKGETDAGESDDRVNTESPVAEDISLEAILANTNFQTGLDITV